eukprot:scaffold348475_cov34-Prasinocladus_malaysianus.AAC.1
MPSAWLSQCSNPIITMSAQNTRASRMYVACYPVGLSTKCACKQNCMLLIYDTPKCPELCGKSALPPVTVIINLSIFT